MQIHEHTTVIDRITELTNWISPGAVAPAPESAFLSDPGAPLLYASLSAEPCGRDPISIIKTHNMWLVERSM